MADSRKQIADEAYLDSVRDLGHPPTVSDMQSEGRYSPGTGKNRWGEWTDVIAVAGLDPDEIPDPDSNRISREAYLTAVQDLAEDLGRPPTITEMNDQGTYTSGPAYRFWDAWSEALEAAGLNSD